MYTYTYIHTSVLACLACQPRQGEAIFLDKSIQLATREIAQSY